MHYLGTKYYINIGLLVSLDLYTFIHIDIQADITPETTLSVSGDPKTDIFIDFVAQKSLR